MNLSRLAQVALAAALLGHATEARAGGMGLTVTSGFHSTNVYFYDISKDYAQYRIGETIFHYGTGLEIVLGDRDDRWLGVFKGYWIQETPERDPAQLTKLVDPANVEAAWREDPRNVGIASVGVQVGFLGQPDTLQMVAVGSMGSGFLTKDHTEFLTGEIGPGFTYVFARSFQFYGNAVYQVRYRKGFQHGPALYAGIRYLID